MIQAHLVPNVTATEAGTGDDTDGGKYVSHSQDRQRWHHLEYNKINTIIMPNLGVTEF